jgi:hypothetical protein
LALDVSPTGVLAAADESGLVTVLSQDRRSTFRIADVDGQSPVVSGIGVLPDGRIAVREATLGRVSVHRPDGAETASWEVSRSRPPHGRDALLVADDGTLFLGTRPELSPRSPPVPFPRPVYVRTTDTGEVLDTLWVGADVVTECPTLSEGHFRAGWFEDFRGRYIPKPHWAVSPDGTLAYGCPARYEFQIARADGSAMTVSRSWRPRAASARERGDFVALWTVQMNNSGVYERWEWPNPSLPETRPAYQRFLLGGDGRIWVWPAQASRQDPAPADWPVAGLPSIIWSEATSGIFDVFEVDGRLLGHVRLPERLPYSGYPNTPDPVIRGDTVWAVVVDESGVFGVERFRVDW